MKLTLSPPCFISTNKPKKKKNKNNSTNQSISLSDPPSLSSNSSSESSLILHPHSISKQELEAVLRRMEITEEELATILMETDKNPNFIQMEQPDEEDLRETFGTFDTDGDGRISAEELWGMLVMLGDKELSLEDCRKMIGLVDRVGTGFVCFDDFVCMMAS